MYVTTWDYFRWELVMNDNLVKKSSAHQNQIPSVQRDSFSACFGEQKKKKNHICMMFQFVIFNCTTIVRKQKSTWEPSSN